ANRVTLFRVDAPAFEVRLNELARSPVRRQAAARLLVRFAAPRSVPLLLELAADPATRVPAVRALARLADPPLLARLAITLPDPLARGYMLDGRLARRTPAAIELFLALVEQPQIRAEALAVIAEDADPPADVLLAYLESPRGATRLAAARAASQIADPA